MNINFEETYNALYAFFQGNPAATIALAIVLLYFLVRKTKAFLVLVLIFTVLTGVFYVISQISSEGTKTKDRMIKVKELSR